MYLTFIALLKLQVFIIIKVRNVPTTYIAISKLQLFIIIKVRNVLSLKI